MKNNFQQKGFSLLQIIVAIAGIAILLWIIWPKPPQTPPDSGPITPTPPTPTKCPALEETFSSKEAFDFMEECEKDLKNQEGFQECDWYENDCPDGWQKKHNLCWDSISKIEGKELGLIFMKADIGTKLPSSILDCCRYYYPQTETVVDWGMEECLWEGIPGDCVSGWAAIRGDLICKMDPESPLANTLIKKCMKNTKTCYFCCPE